MSNQRSHIGQFLLPLDFREVWLFLPRFLSPVLGEVIFSTNDKRDAYGIFAFFRKADTANLID